MRGGSVREALVDEVFVPKQVRKGAQFHRYFKGNITQKWVYSTKFSRINVKNK